MTKKRWDYLVSTGDRRFPAPSGFPRDFFFDGRDPRSEFAVRGEHDDKGRAFGHTSQISPGSAVLSSAPPPSLVLLGAAGVDPHSETPRPLLGLSEVSISRFDAADSRC